MTKLKTLKDLKYLDSDILVDRTDLREEAIKWVKEYRKLQKECKKKRLGPTLYLGCEIALTNFHNITEEDLI